VCLWLSEPLDASAQEAPPKSKPTERLFVSERENASARQFVSERQFSADRKFNNDKVIEVSSPCLPMLVDGLYPPFRCWSAGGL